MFASARSRQLRSALAGPTAAVRLLRLRLQIETRCGEVAETIKSADEDDIFALRKLSVSDEVMIAGGSPVHS